MSVVLAAMLALPLHLDDWLGPPPVPAACTVNMLDYPVEFTPVDEPVTAAYETSEGPRHWTLKPGFLVSECEWVRIINVKSEHRRQAKELETLWELRRREALLWGVKENQYETALLESQGWWQRHAFIFGFTAGVAVVGGTLWAVR